MRMRMILPAWKHLLPLLLLPLPAAASQQVTALRGGSNRNKNRATDAATVTNTQEEKQRHQTRKLWTPLPWNTGTSSQTTQGQQQEENQEGDAAETQQSGSGGTEPIQPIDWSQFVTNSVNDNQGSSSSSNTYVFTPWTNDNQGSSTSSSSSSNTNAFTPLTWDVQIDVNNNNNVEEQDTTNENQEQPDEPLDWDEFPTMEILDEIIDAELVDVAINLMDGTRLPMDRCQGDCEADDTNCAGNLECYQRPSNEIVPGCKNLQAAWAGKDFCFNSDHEGDDRMIPSPDEGVVGIVDPPPGNGMDPNPPDDQGPPTDEPPTDGFVPNTDWDPTNDPPTDESPTDGFVPNTDWSDGGTVGTELAVVDLTTGAMWSGLRLGLCEGDCNGNDFQCEENLKCFWRISAMGTEDAPVPGCTGSLSSQKGISFCYATDGEEQQQPPPPPPESPPEEDNTFKQAELVSSSGAINGMLRCQGHCLEDNDCQGELRCFRRDENEVVPGCLGITSDWEGKFFCYDYDHRLPEYDLIPPPIVVEQDPPPPPEPEEDNTFKQAEIVMVSGMSDQVPLERCQGVCTNHDDCLGDLKCFKRDDNKVVPGCTGITAAWKGYAFCFNSNHLEMSELYDEPILDEPPIEETGDNVDLEELDEDPAEQDPPVFSQGGMYLTDVDRNDDLGRCEGECDDDNDCIDDLVCFKRKGHPTRVPGCLGYGTKKDDYCIDPLDDPSEIFKDYWRLKLFWRDGYNWQERDYEHKPFCMECEDGPENCERGSYMVVYDCDSNSNRFHFIHQDGEETSIQVKETDLCLEYQKDHWRLLLQKCDENEKLQRFRSGFHSDDKLSFNGDRFELQTIAKPGCLTQRHHPKRKERIFREDCEEARRDTTSLWNKY